MLLKESLEGKKYYEDVVRLVDTIIENKEFPKEKLNGKPSQIKILPNKSIFKSDNYAVERVLSIFVSSLFIIAIFGCVYIVSPVDSSRSEINVYLTPSNVHENDTMFVNVTVPSSFGIQSATADMSGIESLDLSLVDNSSGIELWQTVWVVPVVEVGNHIATVTLVDTNNNSFVSEASWSVLSDDVVDGNYSEIPTNENSNDLINQTVNDSVPPINETVDESNNQTIGDENYTEVITNVTGEPLVNDTVLESDVAKSVEDDFWEPVDKPNTVGMISDYRINYPKAWAYMLSRTSWVLQARTSDVWSDVGGLGIVYNDVAEGKKKFGLVFNATVAPISDYRLMLNVDLPVSDFDFDKVNNNIVLRSTAFDKGFVFNFNYSDIAGIPGLIFDYGFENGSFSFVVEKDSVPFGTFVDLDPTYGLIQDVVTSSFEWNSAEGRTPDLIRLWNSTTGQADSEYYLVVGCGDTGTTYDGWLYTLHVYNNNGTIQQSLVDSWEYDNSDAYYPSVCRVYQDIYAIAYNDTGQGKVFTTKVWGNNGSMQKTSLDSYSLQYGTGVSTPANCKYLNIIEANTNIFTVAWQEQLNSTGFIQSLYIDNTGQIGATKNDSVQFNTTSGAYPKQILLQGASETQVGYNYIGIVYTGSGDDGYLATYSVHTSGDIGGATGANVDEWEFDPERGFTPNILHISGYVYAIAYSGNLNKGMINTTSIAASGVITKSWNDSLQFDTYEGSYPTIFHVSGDDYGITYIKDDGLGGGQYNSIIKTINITDSGTITPNTANDCTDALTLDTGHGLWYQPICYVNKSYYLIVYEEEDNDGWSVTVEIVTNYATPTAGSPSPTNGSTGQATEPLLSITISDLNADTMTVRWESNSSGTWKQFASNTSCTNGTYQQRNGNFSNGSTTYYWKVIVSDGDNTIDRTYYFTTASGTMIYYFNAYEAGKEWDTNPAYMVDNDTMTYASTATNNDEQNQNGNTYSGTNWGTILSVEIRAYVSRSNPAGSATVNLTPVFTAGAGSTYSCGILTSAWSSWFNITSATNAPSPWNWSNVTSLDCYVAAYIPGTNTLYCGIVEIRVNYTNVAPYQTGEAPTNTATGICIPVRLYVICRDNNSDTMTATWMSNSSGTWQQFASNTSIANNTNITQTFANATSLGTTYWWSVNLTDGYTWTNNTYRLTTNYAPTQTNPWPEDMSVGINTTPPLNVTCSDSDSNTMTAQWWSNSSGTWAIFATNTSIATGANITQTNSNFSNYSTIYRWSVNLTDGCNWTNTTRLFMTMAINTSVNTIAPYNITSSPLQINATGPSTLSNVTLWYRWNSVNNSWGTAGSNNTYYFTSRTSGWESSPDYMNDSDDTTYASTKTDAQSQVLTTPNSTGSGTITYVYLRCRAYNKLAGSGGNITLRPEFTLGQGDLHTITLTGTTAWYTVDITNDTNASSPWTWSDFDNLQCNVASVLAGGQQAFCSMVQIIVENPGGTSTDWMQWTNNSNPDTSSPWSWNFNFTNGTGYYEFYSIGKKTGSTDETAPTTKDASCHYTVTNQLSYQTGETPINSSTSIDVCPIPALYVICRDNDTGDTMNATWWSNSSGSWAQFATNNSIANNTNITQTNSNFSNYTTTYYWSVNLTDGSGSWTNNTYHFTTQAINTNVDTITPYNITTSPLAITATGDTCLSNVTLWYRFDSNNFTDPAWWDMDWTKRKSINLNVASGETPEDYTVLLNVTYDADMNSDFSDLRFIDYSDDTTVFYYWIENQSDGNWCNVWVEIKQPITTDDQPLAWMYYGNSGATDASDGPNTFVYFDNFDLYGDGEPNPDSWSIDTCSFDSFCAVTASQDVQVSGHNSLKVAGESGREGDYESLATVPVTSGAADYTVETNMWTHDASSNIYGFVAIDGDIIIIKNDWNEWVKETADFKAGGSFNLKTAVRVYSLAHGEVYYDNLFIRKDRNGVTEPGYTIGSEGSPAIGSWINWSNTSNPDTSSPWSWNFDFPNSTGYYEFYSIGKKTGSTDETAPNTKDASCYYTATGSISVTPTTWNMGHVWINDTNATTNTTFTVTNDGGVPILVKIKASNATNGTDAWQLNSTADYDNFTLQYQKSGVSTWTNVNLTYDTFITTLTVGDNNQFGLKMIMATSSSTVNEMSFTVTLLAVAL